MALLCAWAVSKYCPGTIGLRKAEAVVITVALRSANRVEDTFEIDAALYGGLLVYAAISTILPSFVLSRLTQPSASPVQTLVIAPTDSLASQ